ncbi:methyl-accepting chemotaxis protein, partial [Desulfonatronospira sp.]|uniref:methyl-accepting chemotaxis protein n=1 Tax=Desulfonatronospira sp. TaxID=1962951 RepID=UPI0025C4CF7D
FEPWEWIVGTGVYIHDVQQIAGETRNTSLFWTGVIVLVVGAIVVFFIINILKPLMRTISFVEGMSKGELGENLNIKNRDELGRLSSSLNEVQNNINAIIRDVGQMTQSIRHGYIRAALSEDRFRGDYARLASDINHVSGTLASYLETLPISAMTVDDECTVLWMNEKGVKESKTDPVGRKCHEIFGKEGCGTDTCATKKCMSTGSQEYDESSLTVGGKTCYMAYYSTPVKSSDGRTIGAFEVQVDLTEIKLAQQKIQESAERAMSVSDSVSSACDELAAQVEQTSRGTEEQTNRIGETATSMEEMNATVLEVARNASGAAEQADEAKVKAEEGAEIVRQSVEAINEVQEQTRAMKESLNTLGRQSEEIGKVMTVIDDIADQTNLLALNAAIEAARAGDAGRGFAVVADEVRKLAEKTMNATKEVEKTVTSIQESTNSNVENMEQATRMVERATELANSSGHALKQIVNLAQEAADQVRSIATASEEQSSASEEVNRSMEDVNRIARETTDAMNQSAQAVSDLAQQASELQKIIEDLKKT